MRKMFVVFFSVMFCSSGLVMAAPPWTRMTKVIIAPQRGAMIISAVSAVGGDIVMNYTSFTVASVPTDAIPQLRKLTEAGNLELTVREDFDQLVLPGGTVDTRAGVGGGNGRIGGYPPAHAGLYLVQFVSQPLPEWTDALIERDIHPIQYIRENGYLVVATPERIALAKNLRYVQFVDFLHPFLKSRPQRKSATAADVVVSFAPAAGVDSLVEARGLLGQSLSILVDDEKELRVRAAVPIGSIEALLASPLVLSVSDPPESFISDERVTTSLIPKSIVNGAPTRPTRYKYDLANLCSVCSNLNAEGFRVGMTDTGIDRGTNNQPGDHHPDLAFGRLSFGSLNSGDATLTDTEGHGTMVAGVVGGDPYGVSQAPVDSGGFLWGSGVVPSAGLFIQNIPTCNGAQTIAGMATDARAHGTYVLNYSTNYGAGPGTYPQISADADAALIANPLTLTVPAGNRNSNDTVVTQAIGTAKNVIAVGGAESVRPSEEQSCATNSTFNNVAADSYNNAMSFGRHGTSVTGWYKPDLMAPASNVISTRSVAYAPDFTQCHFIFCAEYTSYMMSSGTSFAAPVGAGAALLARRIYAEAVRGGGAADPAAASPALVKAMLVGTARTMYGGIDRADQNATIGARPNARQGFGRISIEELVKPYPGRQYVNETVSFASINSSPFVQTYNIHDTSLPVVVALAWTDPPGMAGADPPRVNDLNLSVEIGSPCTQRYIGNNFAPDASDSSVSLGCTSGTFDSVNNVELVKFASGTATSFTVRVVPNIIDTTQPAQRFGLFVLNAYAPGSAPPGAIASFDASGTSTSNVHLSWQAANGATSYEIQRATDGSPFTTIQPSWGSTTYDDAVASNKAFVYRVRAKNASGVSDWIADAAMGLFFTGRPTPFAQPLIEDMKIRTVHLSELRTAVNYFRAAAGLGTFTFSQSDPATGCAYPSVCGIHVRELRTELDEARAVFNLPALSYGAITSQSTVVQAQHFTQLQDALK